MALILRRRKLGRTSCREIAHYSENEIEVVRNDHPIPEGHNLLIRWGCTSRAPIRNVLNSVESIQKVANKRDFRLLLDEEEVGNMETFGSSQEWSNFVDPLLLVEEMSDEEFERGVHLKRPYIVRPSTHHQGRNVHLCTTFNEVIDWSRHYGEGNYYISPFIPKVAEYRVFCAQGRVVCVARKTPANPGAVAWNVAQGGRFDNVGWGNWPLKACRIALEAFSLSGLDFGGVDVMADSEGNIYVLEINSAPSLASEYRQRCFAKAFDWIIERGKEKIPLIQERGGWRKFIHPAISEEALI